MEHAEDIKSQLKQNYIFFKNIAKPVKYVFGRGTPEYELARSWLDKLETEEPSTLKEIRIRNLYMSHLVACLNEAKLTAPFNTFPKGGQLEPAELGDIKVQGNPPVFTLQQEPAPHHVRAPASPTKSCQSEYECCNVDEFAEQCPRPQHLDTSKGPNDNFCGYVSIHPNVPVRLDSNIAPRATRKGIEAKIGKPGLRSSSEPSRRMAAGEACREDTRCDVSNNKKAMISYEKNAKSRSITTNKVTINPKPTDQIEALVQNQSLEAAEDIEFQLKQNYTLFKKIAKPLKYVFGRGTREYELASTWLDKLEAVEPTTLNEIRIRNLYMSNLVACLNEAKLTEPFNTFPKGGQLEPSEFGGRKVQSNPPVFILQQEPAPHHVRAPAPPKSCQCEYECCNVDEFAQQCPRPQHLDTSKGPNDNFCGYASIHPNVPGRLNSNIASRATRKDIEAKIGKPGLRSSSEPSPRRAAGGACRKDTKCDVSNNKKAMILHGQNTNNANINPEPTDQSELLVQIKSLLMAIGKEVRGLAAPGQNYFLEQELAGYKNFLEVDLDLSTLIKELETKRMLRPYLILHFQRDLVTVVSDQLVPNKERAAKH